MLASVTSVLALMETESGDGVASRRVSSASPCWRGPMETPGGSTCDMLSILGVLAEEPHNEAELV